MRSIGQIEGLSWVHFLMNTAFDVGGPARTVSAIVQALAMESGVDAGEAMKLVNWSRE